MFISIYNLFLPSSRYPFVCLFALFCLVLFSTRHLPWLSGDPLLSLIEALLKEWRILEEMSDSWTRAEKVVDEARTSLWQLCSRNGIMMDTRTSLKELPQDKSGIYWVHILSIYRHRLREISEVTDCNSLIEIKSMSPHWCNFINKYMVIKGSSSLSQKPN